MQYKKKWFSEKKIQDEMKMEGRGTSNEPSSKYQVKSANNINKYYHVPKRELQLPLNVVHALHFSILCHDALCYFLQKTLYMEVVQDF